MHIYAPLTKLSHRMLAKVEKHYEQFGLTSYNSLTYNSLIGNLSDEDSWAMSLAKWTYLADKDVFDNGAATCGLCIRYESAGDLLCSQCPIQKKTGKAQCYGTPYYDYRTNPKAALEELEFLVDLFLETHAPVEITVPKEDWDALYQAVQDVRDSACDILTKMNTLK